ncbi:MAG: glycosyltransferase family 2 protein, partial [Candidatus Lokiarchaeota archaeon]|nr:glycosyltransferase family 2 protein [Candidatus Lokiarchaeota archaeon]
MIRQISVFMPLSSKKENDKTIQRLSSNPLVKEIFLISSEEVEYSYENASIIQSDFFKGSKTVELIARHSNSKYTLIIQSDKVINPGKFSLERFVQVAESTSAGLVFSDYYEEEMGSLQVHPVIDYQQGSLRDDFDFGEVILFRTDAIKEAAQKITEKYNHAGMYDLRLKVSQKYPLIRIPEYLYTVEVKEGIGSEEKHFSYVDPKNRQVQIEMEKAVTQHLKDIGAFLQPPFKEIDFDKSERFEFEASVIIPVRNRVKTIGDAIDSVLKQETNFKFNLIVVDNHSTDGTTEVIKEKSKKNVLVIHIIPDRKDLGIGGCWNEAV